MRKKITLIIIIVLSVITLKLSLKVLLNNIFIKQYNNGEYSSSTLDLNSIINIYEPYIVKYNYGNYFYKNKEYEKAFSKYESALTHHIPDDRICKVKINTSLSLVMQIEKMTNRTEQEEILNKAKSYLDDDCGDKAPIEDQETAEELRKIIDELLKSEGKKPDQKDDKKDSDENDDPLDDKINQIQEDNDNASKNRDKNLEDNNNVDSDLNFCHTNCW